MGIRARIVSFFLMGVLLSALGLVLVQQIVTGPYLAEREEVIARAKALQIKSVLQGEVETLTRTLEDWAYWDESYRFVEVPYPKYVEDNLTSESLGTLGLSSLRYFSVEGKRLWGGLVVRDEHRVAPLTDPDHDDFAPVIASMKAAPERTESQGVYLSDGRWNIVAVRPVLPTAKDKPPAGYMVMTRALDAEFLSRFEQKNGVKVTIVPAADSSGTNAPPEVRVRKSGTVSVLTLTTPDLRGLTFLSLSARVPRETEAAGWRSAVMSTVGNLLILLGFAGVTLLFLGRSIVAPLKDLSESVRQITETGNYTLRTGARREDEFGTLSRGIDALVETVLARTQTLEKLASTDFLTGLANRRAFDEALERAWGHCARHRRPLGLILGDLDLFKLYNDVSGHLAGDDCLRSTARVMLDICHRPGDVAARYGGEELALILPDTDLEGTRHMAQKLCTLVREQARSLRGGRATISLGWVCVIPTPTGDPAALVEEVDRRLYRAKEAGRDRLYPDQILDSDRKG